MSFDANRWYEENSGKNRSLLRMSEKLPFVASLMMDNYYQCHYTEPSIFLTDKHAINEVWVSWLFHMYNYGEDGIDSFELVKAILLPDEMQNVIKGVFVMLHSMIVNKKYKVLPTVPPTMLTSNGLYLSQEWVIDTCIRDNMPPHEAVILAKATLGYK